MNRKTFIKRQGATCANWQWSWSFKNDRDRFIIFGVWDNNETGEGGKILGRDWERNEKGHLNRGYSQALQHIQLITESGFSLLTFPQFTKKDADGKIIENNGKVSIDYIDLLLERRFLFEAEDGWYSTPAPMPPANSYKRLISRTFEEGERASVIASRVERNPKARQACLMHHGYACKVCDILMDDFYGSVGENVIEVHHLHELALCDGPRQVNPVKDLIPVCPNCHTIIHKRCPAYSPDEVRLMLQRGPGSSLPRA